MTLTIHQRLGIDSFFTCCWFYFAVFVCLFVWVGLFCLFVCFCCCFVCWFFVGLCVCVCVFRGYAVVFLFLKTCENPVFYFARSMLKCKHLMTDNKTYMRLGLSCCNILSSCFTILLSGGSKGGGGIVA